MSFCGYETYEKYLQSPEWAAKREVALEGSEHKCCICGTTEPLQVHHLEYTEFEGKDVSQVRVLCKSCHEKVHASAQYITRRYGLVLESIVSAILADAMAVLWKGAVPSNSTTRLKGILLKELERTSTLSGHDAPAIYKAHLSPNRPTRQFDELIEMTTDVWNLLKEEET